jgi:DeoR family transcriptional regulator of aga operon
MKDIKNNTLERRRKILGMLEETNQVLVHDLSQQFSVSEVTIRNDLDQLERKNMLIKVRGGAIRMASGVSIDKNLSEKNKLHYQEKALIGRKAASLINESETILIDSGTTTMQVARNLNGFKDITVLTSALNIANHLVGIPDINVIVIGGYLRKKSYSMVGPIAETSLRNFFVDKLFISVDGFDIRSGGIYTPIMEEAHLNKVMIDIAQEVIVVADSSKFYRRSFAFICGTDKIDKVITDKGLLKEDKQRLEKLGIETIIV